MRALGCMLGTGLSLAFITLYFYVGNAEDKAIYVGVVMFVMSLAIFGLVNSRKLSNFNVSIIYGYTIFAFLFINIFHLTPQVSVINTAGYQVLAVILAGVYACICMHIYI